MSALGRDRARAPLTAAAAGIIRRAFFLVAVAALAGCASVANRQPEPVGAKAPSVQPTAPAAAKQEQRAQGLQVRELSAREAAGQTIVRLKLSEPVSQYRHFPLAQPSRILLDIFGDVEAVPDLDPFSVRTALVDTLRFSSGEGYLRLTLDVGAGPVPAYTVTPEDGALKVVIGGVDAKAGDGREVELLKGGKRVAVKSGETKPPPAESTAPSAAKAETAEAKKYTGQKISLDFSNADIRNIFRLLAEVSGLNIIVTPDVNRKVTLRLIDVPWDQALDLLVDTNGLGKEQIGNVVRISTAEQLKAERDKLVAAQKAQENLEPLQTVYFNVNYAKVKDLESKAKALLSKRPDASLVIDERSNTIMVRDVKKSVDDVSTLIAKLDTRTPQVLIESNLIETTPTFARALGSEIDLVAGRTVASSRFLAGAPFSGSANAVAPPFPVPNSGFRFGYIPNNVNAFISAAENEGLVKVISRPSVVTLNNIASTIRSERILRIALPTSTNIASGSGASAAGSAVATEKVPVGIILTVTPQVSSDGYILLNINVKSSSIANSPTVSSGSTVIPFDELNREAVANVLVKDGETVVLGGILKDTRQEAESGIPYLKDIPILGWLFKNHRWQKDFEELVVFITPRIAVAGSENLPSADQLWREQMKKTDGSQPNSTAPQP